MVRIGALVLLALAACTDDVETRACNATTYDFTTLVWGGATDSAPLGAGECTAYRVSDDPQYRYTYVRFTIAEDVFLIQPIDFTGETPLDGGRWSYLLTIEDYAAHRFSIEAVRDEP